jgi:hypothetical protein
MTRLAALALLLLPSLAACGDVTPGNVAKTRIANPENERLKTLSPVMQRLTLMRAIRQNGKRCQRVESGGYQEYYAERSLEMWVALCNDGRHWGVFIAGNGDVQVRECSQHAQLGLPACRPVAPMPPDPLDPVENPQENASANAF